MTEQIDYESVLADLEARRAALDTAIAGIRQLLGVKGAEGIGAPGISLESRPEMREVQPDSFFGLSIPEASIKFLGMIKQPQSTPAICEALTKGGLHSTAKSFLTTVHTALSRRQKTIGDIVRVKRGQWGLTEWYKGLRRDKTGPVESKAVNKTKRRKRKSNRAKPRMESAASESQ